MGRAKAKLSPEFRANIEKARRGELTPKDFWKLSPAKRRSKGFVAAALERAFVDGKGEDKLVQAVYDGVVKGDARMIELAAGYRWGKPTQEIKTEVSFVDEPLSELLKKLPEAIATLKSAGLTDIAVGMKLGEADEGQGETVRGERPALPDQNLADELSKP